MQVAEVTGVDNSLQIRELRQTVTAVIPVIYQLLSAFKEEGQREEIRKALHDAQWVFVGDRFVQAEQVAFKSQVNATPYLYSVPPDLACFSPLLKTMGVRQSFGSGDFVQVGGYLIAAFSLGTCSSLIVCFVINNLQVLHTIAVETNVVPAKSTKAEGQPVPLTPSQLELSIALVQMISDEVMMVGDWEVFAPDDKRVLARTTDLVYDGKRRKPTMAWLSIYCFLLCN